MSKCASYSYCCTALFQETPSIPLLLPILVILKQWAEKWDLLYYVGIKEYMCYTTIHHAKVKAVQVHSPVFFLFPKKNMAFLFVGLNYVGIKCPNRPYIQILLYRGLCVCCSLLPKWFAPPRPPRLHWPRQEQRKKETLPPRLLLRRRGKSASVRLRRESTVVPMCARQLRVVIIPRYSKYEIRGILGAI